MPARKTPVPKPPAHKAKAAKPAKRMSPPKAVAAPPPVAIAPPVTPGKRGQPPYVPTDKERLTVKVMVAGGIEQAGIASVIGVTQERPRGIDQKTLRKQFRHELEAGEPEMYGRVVAALFSMATTGKNFNAAKWITQARMGWSERIVVDDGKPADTPMRVVVEFVGEAAAPQAEQSAPRSGSRLPDDIRKTVKLVG